MNYRHNRVLVHMFEKQVAKRDIIKIKIEALMAKAQSDFEWETGVGKGAEVTLHVDGGLRDALVTGISMGHSFSNVTTLHIEIYALLRNKNKKWGKAPTSFFPNAIIDVTKRRSDLWTQ